MARYALQRLGAVVLVLAVMSVLVFLATHARAVQRYETASILSSFVTPTRPAR